RFAAAGFAALAALEQVREQAAMLLLFAAAARSNVAAGRLGLTARDLFAAGRFASWLAAVLLVVEQALQTTEQVVTLLAAGIWFAARRFRLAARNFFFAASPLCFAAALLFAAARLAAAATIHTQHAVQELEPEALATQA